MLSVDIEKKLSSFTLKIDINAEGAVSFIGPSGCGKSVMLKCIAGIMHPDKGHIEYNGRVLFDAGKHIDIPIQKRKVGYLFQSYALFPDMTVKENILVGLKWQKDKKKRIQALSKSAELLHISHLLDSKPYQLSGGESQRTALARMIVNEPEIMFFDEPFSALDVFLKEELKAQFSALMKELGKEYIIVTHSMDEAYSLSTSVYVMNNGQIIRNGETEDVFKNPRSRKAASIMGYRNIANARIEGNTLCIPSWNIKRKSKESDTNAVAIMEEDIYFSKDGYPARIIHKIDTPTGSNIQVLPIDGTDSLWMRSMDEKVKIGDEVRISFRENSLKELNLP